MGRKIVALFVLVLIGIAVGAVVYLNLDNSEDKNNKLTVYATVYSHNEDDDIRYGILKEDNGKSYTEQYQDYKDFRNAIISVAEMVKEEGAAYNFEPEWVFLEAFKRFELDSEDTTDLFKDTHGKNLLRYLDEDLDVEIDPHSHEKYGRNYADVAYLISLSGVGPTGIVGGFIKFSSNPEDIIWEKFRAPLEAEYYPGNFWSAEILTNGARVHTAGLEDRSVEEIAFSGVYRPKSTEEPMTHDSKGNLISIGTTGFNLNAFDSLVNELEENGDPSKIYTYSMPCFEQPVYENPQALELCRQHIRKVNSVSDFDVVWKTYGEVAQIWKDEYNEEENILVIPAIHGSSGNQPFQSQKPENSPCGDGDCEGPETAQNCPEDCS